MPRLARRSFLSQLGGVAMLTPLLAACGQAAAPGSAPQAAAPAKPAESKPAEAAKPAESKPAEAAKPAAPAAAAPTQAPASQPAAKAGGELRVAMESDVVTLDPPMFTDV